MLFTRWPRGVVGCHSVKGAEDRPSTPSLPPFWLQSEVHTVASLGHRNGRTLRTLDEGAGGYGEIFGLFRLTPRGNLTGFAYKYRRRDFHAMFSPLPPSAACSLQCC